MKTGSIEFIDKGDIVSGSWVAAKTSLQINYTQTYNENNNTSLIEVTSIKIYSDSNYQQNQFYSLGYFYLNDQLLTEFNHSSPFTTGSNTFSDATPIHESGGTITAARTFTHNEDGTLEVRFRVGPNSGNTRYLAQHTSMSNIYIHFPMESQPAEELSQTVTFIESRACSKIKVGGVWKNSSEAYLKAGGVWKRVGGIYLKAGEVWKQTTL